MRLGLAAGTVSGCVAVMGAIVVAGVGFGVDISTGVLGPALPTERGLASGEGAPPPFPGVGTADGCGVDGDGSGCLSLSSELVGELPLAAAADMEAFIRCHLR